LIDVSGFDLLCHELADKIILRVFHTFVYEVAHVIEQCPVAVPLSQYPHIGTDFNVEEEKKRDMTHFAANDASEAVALPLPRTAAW
jgi:hypothetical protein